VNNHAISTYLRGLMRAKPEHRSRILAGLREQERHQLADAAEEWLLKTPREQPSTHGQTRIR
jgi:hypothetical protein